MRSSAVWLESKCWPIEGNATFATDRFRLATAATMISDARTSPARAGAPEVPFAGSSAASFALPRCQVAAGLLG
jgi:hypothetical protein